MKKVTLITQLRICVFSLAGFFSVGSLHAYQARDSVDIMIGQMIMIGIGDFSLADTDAPIFSDIKEGKAGGVVLYEKNIHRERPKQELASLIIKLQKEAETPLFVSIDEEGGTITRMKQKYGFPKSVSAQYLGTLDKLDSTRFYARQTASLLDSFGINMNYAPVLDVNLNAENPVIGKLGRSYSPRYEEVIAHSEIVIDEHRKRKIVCVTKHFPGHGSSRTDSHLGLTDVTLTWQVEEIYPYATLIEKEKLDAIMTAHIVNKLWDPTFRPATLSKPIVKDMLRDFLDYDGVVITDDMEMGAIRNEYGMRESIRLSLLADVDILMFANTQEQKITADTVHTLIKDLIVEGQIPMQKIERSYKRIMRLKKEMGLLDPKYFLSLKRKLKKF